MKTLLKIIQKQRYLSSDNNFIGYEGTSGSYIYLSFEDDYFNGYAIGLLCNVDKKVYELKLNSDNNLAILPAAILKNSGHVYFSLYGVGENETITTELLDIFVGASNVPEDAVNSPDIATAREVATQIVNSYIKNTVDSKINSAVTKADDALKKADESSKEISQIDVKIKDMTKNISDLEKEINDYEIADNSIEYSKFSQTLKNTLATTAQLKTITDNLTEAVKNITSINDTLAKLRMVKGTVVLNTSGQSGNGFQFMSLNAIRTLFNDTSIGHLMVHCIVSNGDSLANQCHVVGTAWTNGDILSVTLDAPTDGAFRVNYLMFVIKE